jgi:LCP family protein required for cell wall assembly
MVVSVDYANRQVGVISFPRDLYVDIPTVGKNRINTATFFGGVNRYPNGGDIGLLKDTLAQNFDIRIDHYVKFNFETFKDMIDALGGIDIAVICPITGRFPVEPGSNQLVWQTLPAGQYHMDGEFALRYVRERKTTSDVDRNRRQQRVLIAMRKRAREVNIVPRIPALYDAMRDNIETDLGLTDIIALTRLGLQIDTRDVHGFNIGYKEVDSWTTPGGASVLKPDMDKINEGIRTLFSKPSILKNPTKPRSCR